MKLSQNACAQVAQIVMGGSAVLVGCGSAGAIPAAIGGTTLATFWLNHRQKSGADSQAVLKKVTKVVERDWTKHDDYDFTTGLDIKAASGILVAALPEICLTPAEVARTATKHNGVGFPNAATALIVGRLLDWCGADGRSERLFEVSPKAKLFVETVFNLAFAAAIEDRNYFEQFEPHLLVDIAGYVGDTNRRVVALEDVVREEAKETRAHVTDEVQALKKELLTELRNQRKTAELPEVLLAALAERTDASLSLEDQVSDLISRFDAAQELIREGSAPSNLDAFVTAVQKRVAEKTLAGDLDGADAEAEGAFEQWEQEETERAAAAQRNGVALIETAIETALARGDAEAVARREMRKIALTVPEAERFDAARNAQDIYDKRGQTYGARIDLRIAAALARAYGQTDSREHWAMAKNDLGAVLRVLGSRGEEGALQEAVTAYRAALEVRKREAAPMQWAMTQNNLGIVLQVLGSRGEEGALQEAVAVYRAALEVRTREAAPMQWAMTQNNLGNVLQVLGERGQDSALQEAVAAYRASLEVYTRATAPMQWALIQENLALVFEVLADQGDDPLVRLEAGLEAVSWALQVFREAEATFNIEKAARLEARLREKLASS